MFGSIFAPILCKCIIGLGFKVDLLVKIILPVCVPGLLIYSDLVSNIIDGEKEVETAVDFLHTTSRLIVVIILTACLAILFSILSLSLCSLCSINYCHFTNGQELQKH